MRCQGCGAELRLRDRFCSSCGRRVERQALTGPPSSQAATLPALRPLAAVRPGELFAGRFQVREEIGSGGMGVVYRVEEKDTGRTLALKVLRPEFSRDVAAETRFSREIGILAKIRHPSIPRIFEWGSHDDCLFFVTELIAGRDLDDLLRERGRLPADEAVPLLCAVAEALGSAHQAGVVHRDLKPKNVMVSEAGGPDPGRVYLIDFGVARNVSTELTMLTETGVFVGTPQYMSPEQLDSHRTDERSDIYSFGVMMFQLLTGRLPFDGETPLAVVAKHLQEKPPSPRSICPSISFLLESIILRCLEKNPSNRFWTVNELLAKLRQHGRKELMRRRVLANGDIVVEDPERRHGWALSISTPKEKTAWDAGMTLYYRDAFYGLVEVGAPDEENREWQYCFEPWPDSEIMRRVVDYEAEVSALAARSAFARARRWIHEQIVGP